LITLWGWHDHSFEKTTRYGSRAEATEAAGETTLKLAVYVSGGGFNTRLAVVHTLAARHQWKRLTAPVTNRSGLLL
jgi:hypothetical protein